MTAHGSAGQNMTAKFGMWLFLGSEVMFFSGFISTYIVLHNKHEGSKPAWKHTYINDLDANHHRYITDDVIRISLTDNRVVEGEEPKHHEAVFVFGQKVNEDLEPLQNGLKIHELIEFANGEGVGPDGDEDHFAGVTLKLSEVHEDEEGHGYRTIEVIDDDSGKDLVKEMAGDKPAVSLHLGDGLIMVDEVNGKEYKAQVNQKYVQTGSSHFHHGEIHLVERSVFHPDSRGLSIPLATLNTIALILSSFTMALAISAIQRGDQTWTKLYLLFTILLACVFLVVKTIEYTTKFNHEIFPSTNIFYGSYFLLTGFHGFHVVAGIIALSILLFLTIKGHYNENRNGAIECTGLYWHIVDLVWIFLFPMLYLLP
jgi:heme/copper-type cytochrome/quinol oxidase subunit 3